MKQRCFRRARSAFIAAIAILACGTARAETLREVLRAQKAPGAEKSLPNLDKPITSYQVLDDGKNFLIAYYVDSGSGIIDTPLIISRFDKFSRSWQTKELNHSVLQDDGCLGSAIGAQSVGDRIYVELHINPSASCMLVLAPDLALQKTLGGWFLAAFADGRIIFHDNEIHFAPVHAAELSLFDPRTNSELKIYPRKPFQTIRAAHIEKLRAFYSRNEDWCNAHNNPCDPEWFDSDIAGDVAINDQTDSLAFVIRFDNTNFWSDADRTKLEAFRETRKYLREHPGAPPDGVLTYLFSDLGRIGRLNQKPAVLDLFPAGNPLREFIAAAFQAKEAAPENLREFSAKLGPQWSSETLRNQFLQAIETSPEFTSVLYVYRNLRHPEEIEYHELLLDDWKFQHGDAPLAKALESETLRQIFER